MFSRTYMTRFWFIALGLFFLWSSTHYDGIPPRGALYEYSGQFERILDRTGRDDSGFIFTLKGIKPAFHYVRNAGNNREIFHQVQTSGSLITIHAQISTETFNAGARDLMEVFEIEVHGKLKQDYNTIVERHERNGNINFIVGIAFLLAAAYLIIKKVEFAD